jgi:hypothetical protein
MRGPLAESGSELAEDADEALAVEGVDLVEKQHQRAGTGSCPCGESDGE